jgi:mono/diheme cytochrome c family protein
MKIAKTIKFLGITFSSLLVFSFVGQLFFDGSEFSLKDYKIEEGFDLSLVAEAPHFEASVTMDFDDQGRIWVVEMRGYMPNLEGIGEDMPNGRITILEDLDKDGIVDNSKVFLDGLVLPRALAHVYGGLLYTDGPALYFVKIKNDKPGKRVLVDPIYADGGNVEHQPNGLMMNIDNWIYNANTHFRYRMVDGEWIKEPTSYRGQWGISKDNFGRLYVNNNSTQLQGDHVLPNTAIRNPYFKPRYSVNQRLTPNQKVYPLHATAVNRGYMKGVLDEEGKLTTVTASCGPLVYRGGTFPVGYDQNAFVCVPEANLIKRNLLTIKPTEVSADQAWDDKEFLASTDEGFRPVNLFNGPDGAMYVVDMHRGIIQHKAFISQYLTQMLSDRKLDTLQHQGRILKVTATGNSNKGIPDLSKAKPQELVKYLSHENGWLRDRAQQLLIRGKGKKVKDELWQLTKTDNQYASAVHALYTLEGLNLISFEELNALLKVSPNSETSAHILRLMESFASPQYITQMAASSTELLTQNDVLVDLYLASSLKAWIDLSPDTFLPKLNEIASRYPEDNVVQEVIVSSLDAKEQDFNDNFEVNAVLSKYLSQAIESREKSDMNSIYVVESRKDDGRTNGLKLFRTICGACHGADGSGIPDLAPPLKNSEYIDGSVQRLASILLHGISGPLHVNGELYELNNDMPGLVNNPDISDQDIADIIGFLQNAFAKEGKRIRASEIEKLRSDVPEGGVYTEKLLLETKFER